MSTINSLNEQKGSCYGLTGVRMDVQTKLITRDAPHLKTSIPLQIIGAPRMKEEAISLCRLEPGQWR